MMPLLSPPSSTTQEEMVRVRQSGNCKWKKQQRKVKQKNKPAYRPLDLLWFGEIRSWSQSAVRKKVAAVLFTKIPCELSQPVGT